MKGQDVVICLPTGGGKSLCYATIPWLFDYIVQYLNAIRTDDDGHSTVLPTSSIMIVLSPLISLMKDQVATFSKRGIKCAMVYGRQQDDIAVKAGIACGAYQLIYLTPECLILSELRDILLSSTYRNNLVGISVDEAHCIDIW